MNHKDLDKLMRNHHFIKVELSEDGLAWKITMNAIRAGNKWVDMDGNYVEDDMYIKFVYRGNHKTPVLTDPRNDYLKPDSYRMDLPSCYIVDIDGTIALINNRSPYNGAKAHTDSENLAVTNLLRLFYNNSGNNHIIYSTGRDEQYREATEAWLKSKGIFYGGSSMLLMRPAGEKKPDAEVKKDNFMRHIYGKYNVELVLEDRARVTRMYRDDLRLPTLEPWYSNF